MLIYLQEQELEENGFVKVPLRKWHQIAYYQLSGKFDPMKVKVSVYLNNNA